MLHLAAVKCLSGILWIGFTQGILSARLLVPFLEVVAILPRMLHDLEFGAANAVEKCGRVEQTGCVQLRTGN